GGGGGGGAGDGAVGGGVGEGGGEGGEARAPAVPEEEVVGGDAERLAHRLGQGGRRAVRVEMDALQLGPDRVHRAGGGADRVLVRRQPHDRLPHLGFERGQRRRRHVRLDRGQHGAP